MVQDMVIAAAVDPQGHNRSLSLSSLDSPHPHSTLLLP